ncbi:MAG: hypothetical protein AVDCRST_MAG64-3028 [uncultured Phycisphaerae bacterium]|uniref:Uncharacterized protein n=1 Tax=uncultured Phycisphaerae bacterium TaxID=904963 RepID=A0A6J4PRQ4_9BACT|nr:MAG: hypothetical protein AVDCRST_MAG64-3028 [uncultured Phycisphaerae bacterium]
MNSARRAGDRPSALWTTCGQAVDVAAGRLEAGRAAATIPPRAGRADVKPGCAA